MTAGAHNQNVDALRGLAAVVVVIHHVTTQFPVWTSGTIFGPLMEAVGGFNQDAVLLFFVISGYCIYSAVVDRPVASLADLRPYALRRSLRILPAYWMAIALTAVLMISLRLADTPLDCLTLLGNLAFLQTSTSARGNWFSPFGGNGPLWSISYEVFYYLLFPLLLIASQHLGRFLGSLPFAAGASIAALGAGYFTPNPFLSFLGLYFVWRAGAAARECCASAQLRRRTTVFLICFAMAAALALQAIQSDTARALVKGAGIALLWILLQTYCRTPNWLMKVSKPAIWAGEISYSLYLIHFPILVFTRETIGDQASGVLVGLLITVLLAWRLEHICARLKASALRRLTGKASSRGAIARQTTIL